MSMYGGFPNHSRDEAAAYERKQWLEHEVPNASEHAEQVREARQARQASEDRMRWRVAWGRVVGMLLAAAIVGSLVLLLVLRRPLP